MSTNISSNLLKTFILSKIGGDTMDRREAKDLSVSDTKFEDTDIDKSDDLDIDEIMDDKELYEQFATMYVEEDEKKTAKDEEEEKRRPVESGSKKGKA